MRVDFPQPEHPDRRISIMVEFPKIRIMSEAALGNNNSVGGGRGFVNVMKSENWIQGAVLTTSDFTVQNIYQLFQNIGCIIMYSGKKAPAPFRFHTRAIGMPVIAISNNPYMVAIMTSCRVLGTACSILSVFIQVGNVSPTSSSYSANIWCREHALSRPRRARAHFCGGSPMKCNRRANVPEWVRSTYYDG